MASKQLFYLLSIVAQIAPPTSPSSLMIIPRPLSMINFENNITINHVQYTPWTEQQLDSIYEEEPQVIVYEEAGLANEGTIALASKICQRLDKKIKFLSLKRNSIGPSGGAAILKNSFLNNKIFNLNLELNCIGDIGLRTLPSLTKHNDWMIEELNLRSNMISVGGAKSLSSSLMNSYKRIIRTKTTFSSTSTSSSSQRHNLKRLYLGGNPIGNDGVISLSIIFQKLDNLSVLDLSNCDLTDKGIIALCQALPDMKSLRHLNLGRNKITALGMKKLCEVIPLTSIITLDLRSNQINDIGAKYIGKLLSSSITLSSLHVGWNHICAQGIENFRRYLKFNKIKPLYDSTIIQNIRSFHIDFSGNQIDRESDEYSFINNQGFPHSSSHPSSSFKSSLSQLFASSRSQTTTSSETSIQNRKRNHMSMMHEDQGQGRGSRILSKLLKKQSSGDSYLISSLSLRGCGISKKYQSLLKQSCPETSTLSLDFN